MNAIDILGDLLGRKTKKPGRGTDILKDIFGRGSQQSSRPSSSGASRASVDINSESEELEDLLNVANDRKSRRQTSSIPNTRERETTVAPAFPSKAPRKTHANRKEDSRESSHENPQDERTIALIRAMVNAAKADGRLDETEQKKIIDELGNPSRENIDFLRKEFARPLDVQEFVRSVPIGMEQQVYSMSLIAIDLDQDSEANYLLDLAQGLRIPTDVRKQIHKRLGAPDIY